MSSKLHQAPPFRAEHMGSLLRPQKLLDIREGKIRDQGLSEEEAGLPAVEKESVVEVVKLQRDLGIKGVTSGEFNRTRFWGLMWDEFEGSTRLQDAEASMFRLYHPDVVSLIEKDRKVMPGDSVIAGGKLSHSPSKSKSNLHELRLVQAALPKEEWKDIKLTMITPAWFHMRYKQGRAYTKEAYANDAEYFKDVARVYQAELQQLYDAGLRNVQFDDPGMAYFCSQQFRKGWEEDKDNDGTVEDLLDAYIALYNDTVSKLPEDMHTGIHLCRGNFIGGRHFAEGSYDIIAKKLFQNLNVNTFYLEYDTERAGGFEPLQFLPKNKNVVVGIISTKVPKLEDKEEMKARVLTAAEYVAKGSGETKEEALKRICVSPQCGFSTHESGYPLSLEDEKNKLSLIRKIAEEIWGEA
ncbi:5-methyltetrahydropteroyltriglutamate-homocysteine methyltransferase [Colletotrichum godetiae]|uniref:5-methyltetrahydropteroyltriglutamate-homocysteine methyltransferase n=1 Tax=Colletotrichum godetiae TaxID=1209918 RepID=A0AAJ0ASJ4_9PEZI|nr:5-methyltetrahydropteroyltriglutamate-homocysteine methyltransferase [Colletotrichum godetiae]KAK1689583.1 5-methyltetrahydropteroyltriglutamate-homocysteine methyltransferase [Colletotrichum godetiae]